MSTVPDAAPGPSATLADLPLRPELVGEVPYGAPQLDVPVRLNVNENPYPVDARVTLDMVTTLTSRNRDMNRYPDRDAVELRAALATYLGFGLTADNIWVGNGSNEVMTHLLGAFGGPGRRMLTFTPTYSMYPEYARNTHTEFRTAPRRADYGLDADLVLAAIEREDPDIIVITTPNNPTGTLTPVSTIEQICAKTRAIVIVDEAYQEFTPTPDDSSIALLPSYPRLVVTRTMSKAFAFAGGRLGYLAANPAVVEACRIVRLPYHLSAQTQIMARVALRHADLLLARVDELREQCQQIQVWLRERGLEVIPSEANFCLFGRFTDRHAVWQALLDRGVLIRETGPAGFLRVSAGTPDEMKAFRQALDEVLPTADRSASQRSSTEENR